jgi:oxepin-CoA hydrolase/3-oxo-5,6-dehydrosuberyl-CoA semialdehyde dehydrogenase
MPEGFVLPDGEVEMLSRDGSFLGQHVLTPRQGIALQINAFNFPVWGMLEKLAPSLLAGVPSLVKPASDTGYLTQAVVRLIADSGILPEGALQLIMGGHRGSFGLSGRARHGGVHRQCRHSDGAAQPSLIVAKCRALHR